MNKQELLKLIRDKNLKIGFKEAVKAEKSKKAEAIILASNCPEDKVSVFKKAERFDGDSKELGIVCGKPFNIAVLTVMK